MLSHLRFHRRGPASTPSSPVPDQNPPSPITIAHPPLSAGPTAPHDAFPAPSSASSALPPMLPPITRVTSNESEPGARLAHAEAEMLSPASTNRQPPNRSPNLGTEESGFLGGLALENYRRGVEAQSPQARPETADGMMVTAPTATATEASQQPRSRPVLPAVLSHPEMPTRPPPQPTGAPRSATSFTSPTELQQPTMGKRPAGARLTSEPPALAAAAAHPVEPQKSKKSLPFLKNPMSTLLMRRKNSHNAPDILPLPLNNEEPAYDPRIRGTRVHDFSAPRRKQQTPKSEATSSTSPDRKKGNVRRRESSSPEKTPMMGHLSGHTSSASGSVMSQTLAPSTSASSRKTKMSVDVVPEQPETAPPVPPKDQDDLPTQKSSTRRKSRVTLSDEPSRTKSINSLHSASQSRKPSLVDRKRDTMSSIPRHMKSTSSRFSFDMIGAAKQEKLLEERHRQREAEKQANDPEPGPRDSRYDDFDEDAMYEAMMEEDYEEEIPGMNDDDYDEDDFLVHEDDDDDDGGFGEPEGQDSFVGDPDDPDNDQDNFEGFVFQRSNPGSELASPQYALETPRDATGQVIGFAMTRDTPPTFGQSLSPLPLSPFSPQQPSPLGEVAGLGIQGMTLSPGPSASSGGDFAAPAGGVPPQRDELDFGSGVMSGFENEFAEDLAADPAGDGVPFDESIFDNNDTDQYGRPIAGAFASALSVRRSKQQESLRLDTSERTLSPEQPQSLGNELPKAPEPIKEESSTATSPTVQDPLSPAKPQTDPMAAYQAALSAAAFKAAASGKFTRDDTSPEKDSPDEDILDNETGLYPEEDNRFDPDAYEDDDEDDFSMSFNNGMDDYELDDDAIIAEANASALANDSDGWYGSEFGFYSAAPAGSYGSFASSSSEKSGFEYANGGFFGPKGGGGLDRTKSGRVLNREANLTPITERSEYSNRNSVMSLALPPGMMSGGTPSVTSPGLAQLVMMADHNDQMSLSALMRLRNKAWGGSQLSLSSSREGSPRSERGEMLGSPWGPGPSTIGGGGGGAPGSFGASSSFASVREGSAGPGYGHHRMNSVMSTGSTRRTDSEAGGDGDGGEGSVGGSPTLTGVEFPPPQPTSAPPPVPGFAAASNAGTGLSSITGPAAAAAASSSYFPEGSGLGGGKVSASSSRHSGHSSSHGHGHRHKTSADSISYVHQQEEGTGEGRWVIERRRTGESGREILEREVVEGGRI